MRNTKLAIIIGLVIATVACMAYFSDVLYLFVIASIIAFILNPLVRGLSKKLKIKKGLSVAVVFLLIVVAFSVLLSIVIPNITSQLSTVSNNMPTYVAQLNSYLDDITKMMTQWNMPVALVNKLDTIMAQLEDYLTNVVWNILTALLGSTTKLLDILIVVIVSIYLILDARMMFNRFLMLFPKNKRQYLRNLAQECTDVTWKYLKVKTIIAFGMALVTFIVLSILNIEYAFLLAIIAFLLDYIPYFGSIVSGIIAAGVALVTTSLSKTIVVIICIMVIQQIEGNVVTPKVQGDSVGLHPIVVILALLVCNRLCGPIGMFIAVPLFCIFKIFLREIYKYLVADNR